MAIWSLTQERVEKLLKQIGDKEDEVDALIKLTPKDLWNIDLEAFVEEWNLQLVEEAERGKKIQRMGRRASHKLGISASKGGKAKKKRKMGDSDSDDSGSDFGPVQKKAKPKKEGLLSHLRGVDPPAVKASPVESTNPASGSTASKRQGGLLSHLVKNDIKMETPPQTDEPSSPADEPLPAPKPTLAPAAKARGRSVAAKKPVISDDEIDSDIFAVVAKEDAKKPAPKTNGRAPRAATKPVSKYAMDSDSDDSDDLGDVSTMVKTIGGSSNGVPMFKASTSIRPGSSSGMPKVAKKASPSVIDIDEDDTNYEALMPRPSPKKPAPRNVNDTLLNSDSEDDFSLVKPKPAASKITKVAPKAKTAPKAKASAAVEAKKSTVLSPVAKTHAARLEKTSGTSRAKVASAKKPTIIDSDEDIDDTDALADKILSDEEDELISKPKTTNRTPAVRPGRRVAAKTAKYIVSDDDEEEEDDEASELSYGDDSE